MTHSIQDFLEIRTASASGFSPDGDRLLVSSNLTGTSQLYRLDAGRAELVRLTDFDEPVAGGYLPASDEILLAMHAGGNERTQLYLMNDDGSDVRPLVVDPEFIHSPGGMTRDGKTLAYATNRRNGADFDVFVRDLASSEERCVFELGGWCSAAGFSPDGRFLAVMRLTERAGDNEVHLVDLVTDERFELTPHKRDAYVGSPSWLPDSSGFFFSHNVERDVACIARFEMADRNWTTVLERDWDLRCQIDWPGRTLLVTANEEGFTRLERFDPATMTALGEIPLPGAGIAGGRFSRDGSRFAYTFVSSTEPGDAWVYELTSGETTRLTTSPNPVPSTEFVEPTLHRFASFDGESIPVFLYLPRNSAGPCPVVVTVHGGPESQYVPSFAAVTQYLVHRGYAVAAPNVRGSTGYGKRYQALDDVRLRMDSVRDLASLHAWLSARPEIDPSRAALWGGSYGGYMVLAGLAFQPDLWAAGVDIVGISSLETFLRNTSDYRRKFREREYGSLDHDLEFLREVSPITRVDDMRAPLAIIHGANDPRVPLSEAEQIHAVLTEKSVPCELLVYHDEGHGLAKLKNRLDAYPKVVDFLDGVLR